MAKQRMTATQRLLLEEQEDRERAARRAETRREAAIELGEIVIAAGGQRLPADLLSRLVREAVDGRDGEAERPLTRLTKEASRAAGTGSAALPNGVALVREPGDELVLHSS